jgi:hydroxyacylglutathione hydrolase
MISIKSFIFNAFMENTYILYDETKECVVIDPGCYDQRERNIVSEFIKEKNLKVVKLLNTHCHIDHVLGNDFIKKEFNVDLYIHKLEEATLKSVEVYAPAYGFKNYEQTKADFYLSEGVDVNFGNSTLAVMFAPGHAPGHVVFYSKEQNFLIGGDVLFRRSIGRTDLPGGDHETLIKSIKTKLFPLDNETVVYSGHGDVTNIGHEKKYNPFCGANS